MSGTVIGEKTDRWQRRRNALRLAGLAGGLVVAETVGYWCSRDGGLLWPARLLHHPVLFGVAAAAALGAALLLMVRNTVVRVLLTVAACGLALVVLLVVVSLAFSAGQDTEYQGAPGRTDLRVAVVEDSDVIDPVWRVYIDEGRGPATRRWHVGTFDGDVPQDGLTEAAWDGPDRLRLVIGGGEEERVHLIDVDPATGRPSRTVSTG